ncbi:unnamed protein product, partial [Prorocentrum cordatum]
MREAKLEANVISYSAGISACELGRQWHRALALLSEMREAKLEPDVMSATTLGSARARRASSGSGLWRCSARCGRRSWSPTQLQRRDPRVREGWAVAAGAGAAQRVVGGEASPVIQAGSKRVLEGRVVELAHGSWPPATRLWASCRSSPTSVVACMNDVLHVWLSPTK